jgi:hypothetical protein
VSHNECQVFFPVIEAHVNTVGATILSEPSVKRLMNVADQVSHEPQGVVRFSLRGASADFITCTYHAIASMTQLRSLQSRCWSYELAPLGKLMKCTGPVGNLASPLCPATSMRRLTSCLAGEALLFAYVQCR